MSSESQAPQVNEALKKENIVHECPVCIEKYTKVRREISCPKCENDACHRCVQRYITETLEDPHCMHCKHPFDRQFLHQQLTKTFMTTEYVQKRRDILWNREESYLPGAMAFIPLLKETESLRKERLEIEKTLTDLYARIQTIQLRRQTIDQSINSGVLPENLSTEVVKAQQKFVRHCIKETCKGWLSTQWKCDLCDTRVCSDCYQPKTTDHICKKEDIDTADYIRKNAKNCPGCGEMIEKKDGCDMMFCTSCHTAFSWKTLEISKGAIHNPHYFAWRQAQGVNERTIGDIQCGGVPDTALFNHYSDMKHRYHFNAYSNITSHTEIFDRLDFPSIENARLNKIVPGEQHGGTEYYSVKISKYHKLYLAFSNICRYLEHARHHTLPGGRYHYNEDAVNTQIRHMRLNYLQNNITKDAYKIFLANEEKKREKLRILSQPIDTLYNAASDILRRAIPSAEHTGIDMSIRANRTPENYETIFQYGKTHLTEYFKLLDFINDIYEDISHEFNTVVPNMLHHATETFMNYKRVAAADRKYKKERQIRNATATPDSDSDSDYTE